jgi:hypothetical protein
MKSSLLVVDCKPPGQDKTASESGQSICIPFPIKTSRKEENPVKTGDFLPAA